MRDDKTVRRIWSAGSFLVSLSGTCLRYVMRAGSRKTLTSEVNSGEQHYASMNNIAEGLMVVENINSELIRFPDYSHRFLLRKSRSITYVPEDRKYLEITQDPTHKGSGRTSKNENPKLHHWQSEEISKSSSPLHLLTISSPPHLISPGAQNLSLTSPGPRPRCLFFIRQHKEVFIAEY